MVVTRISKKMASVLPSIFNHLQTKVRVTSLLLVLPFFGGLGT